MIKRICIAVFVSAIFLTSCTSKKNIVYLNNRPTEQSAIQYEKKSISNTLQSGDIIYVKILSINNEINSLFNLDNSSSQANITSETTISLKGFSVSPEGYITLPIIDTVKVQGLTIFEAQTAIQEKVNSYFKNATVIVKLLNSKISVLGEVQRPGSFIINRDELTIFEALALAGDANTYGDKKNILIIRTTGTKNETYKVDLTDESIMNSDHLYLLPNDIVIVQPLKLKTFRANLPTITLILSAITTYVGIMNMIKK